MIVTMIGCAIALGLVGSRGGLAWTSADLAAIVHDDLFRPRRFLCAYGIHLGDYVGGAAGTVVACVWVGRSRKDAVASAIRE